MTLRSFLPVFFSAVLPLAAQNVLDLQFSGETATDTAGGRAVELQNVVVMGSGAGAYGDVDGKGAIVVTSDPELSFGPQDTLWIEMWVNPVQIGKTGILLTKGSGANYRVSASPRNQFSLSYYSLGKWRALQSETPLALNEWQHIACLFDAPAGTITLLLNGRVVAHSTDMPAFQSKDATPLLIAGNQVQETGEYVGMVGGVGRVIIARGNPREVPSSPAMDQQVYDVQSPF